MPTQPLLELGGKALDPAVHGRVVDGDAAVGEHGLEVAVADRELEIPAHGPQDHLGGKAEAAECSGVGHERCSRRGWRRERRSYPLRAPRSTQRNPQRGPTSTELLPQSHQPLFPQPANAAAVTIALWNALSLHSWLMIGEYGNWA